MSIQKRARLLPWIAGLALVAITAAPSIAASTTVNKLYTIDVAGPGQTLGSANPSTAAANGDRTFTVKITNATPGSSNFQSVIVNAPTAVPAGTQNIYVKNAIINHTYSNNGNQNGQNASATLSWLDKNGVSQCTRPATVTTCPVVSVSGGMKQGAVYVQSIDPVKSANNLHQAIAFDITLTTPALSGCTAVTASPTWTATPINGSSLSGDTFAYYPLGSNSGQTTQIAASCGTLTIQKYLDDNVNDTFDSSESLITDTSWDFTVYAGTSAQGTGTVASTATTTTETSSQPAGTVSLTVPGGSYYICETDSKLTTTDWRSTDPNGCKSTTVTSGSTTTVSFGNKIGTLGCDPSNNFLETDSGATLTRGPNKNGSDCTLKPASLDYNATTGVLTFLATGTDPATYTITIPWAPVANTNPPPNITDQVDLPGGLHDMKWCETDGSEVDGFPNLPPGEVACILSQTWTVVNASQIQRVDTIYAEVDLVVSKKT